MRIWASVIIGLGVPVIGVVGVIPFIASTDATVAGIPLLFAWMFTWFPLTSACMWFCWWRFDRHDYAQGDAPSPEAKS